MSRSRYTPKKFLQDIKSDMTAFGYPCFKVSRPQYAETWAGRACTMVVNVDTGERFEVIIRSLPPRNNRGTE